MRLIIRAVYDQSGLSSGGSIISLIYHQGGLLSR